MRSLYIESNAGISGDMSVAALLDLGADENNLKEVLNSIPDDTFQVNISKVKKCGVECSDFDVILKHDNHDHDMNYLHSHDNAIHSKTIVSMENHEHDHDHKHEHSHEHSHEHDHNQEHKHEHNHAHSHEHRPEHSHPHEHHHAHAHRSYNDVKQILAQINMTAAARTLAEDIFGYVARAESKAHGVPIDEVHFHEVGAIDSIVDIVAFAVCLEDIKNKYNISNIIIPYLTEGCGTIRCQHGILPVPVPATCNIIEESSLILKICNVQGELVTPTGAAIAAAITTTSDLPESFSIKAIGLGAGKRTYERPSILRMMIIESNEAGITSYYDTDTVQVLETNIDDCSGEMLSNAIEKLLKEGALDAFASPIIMKKGRPAYKISVICSKDTAHIYKDILFKETTTIGIREYPVSRAVLKRTLGEVETKYGKVKVKICVYDNQQRIYPEYNSVKELSESSNISFYEIYVTAANANLIK